eukprot:gene4758-21060_t
MDKASQELKKPHVKARDKRQNTVLRSAAGSTSCADCKELVFTKSPRNKTVTVNDKVRLRCRVTGAPLPHVAFLWNGKPMSENEHGKTITSDKNTYTERRPQVPAGPVCLLYRNSTCKNEINPPRAIYATSKESFLFQEKKLRDTYKSIMKQGLITKVCRPYVLPLLCHTQFPYCAQNSDKTPDSSSLVELCRDDCLKLQNDICKTEYIAAKADKFFSRELLPDCSKLPASNCVHILSEKKPWKRKKNRLPVTIIDGKPVVSDRSLGHVEACN